MKFITYRKMSDVNSLLKEAVGQMFDEYRDEAVRNFKARIEAEKEGIVSFVESKLLQFIKESGSDEITIRFKGE